MTFWGGHYVFSFYPDYNYLFYLILAVLFLQSWNNFRLLFAKQSLKWVLISAIILGLFSFTLSKVNFIDQEAFQKRKLEASIYYKYDFELPRSDYYKRTNGYLSTKLELVLDSSEVGSTYVILLNNHKISLNNLRNEIQIISRNIPDYYLSRGNIHLFIDNRISIEFVEKVKAEIARTDVYKIYYMVVPLNPEYDVRYYSNYGIEDRVSHTLYHEIGMYPSNFPAPPPSYEYPLLLNTTKQIKLNSDKATIDELVEVFRKIIMDEPGKIIRYKYNPKDPFYKYIKVLSAAHQAAENLREELYLPFSDTMTEYQEYELMRDFENEYRFDFQAIPKEK